MKTMRLLIVGFGIIGTGVVKAILSKKKKLAGEYGAEFQVIGACEKEGSVIDEKGLDLERLLKAKESGKFSKHPDFKKISALEAIEKMEADVMIECTPTNISNGEPGLRHIQKALSRGMHVVTSNKGPPVLKYKELEETAKEKGVQFKFEATVGGGMPVINLARKTLHADEIKGIRGILNGTTNFILTKMHDEGVNFETALHEAREMGIAEADPSYDVEGVDAAAKLAILGNALMNKNLIFKDVERTGIDKVTPEAVDLAKKNGYSIKLLAVIEDDHVGVSPQLIPSKHPLNVDGTLNALMLETDLAKEIVVVGRGAGQMETASAVLSDLVDIAEETEAKN